MVECDLAKVEVAGSNPVSRSIPLKSQRVFPVGFFYPDILRRIERRGLQLRQ